MSYENVRQTINDEGSAFVANYSKTPTTCCQNSRLLGVFLYFELCIACLLLS